MPALRERACETTIAVNRFCFTANCEADTERLGEAIADALEPGDVVALNGDLGAGKTRLVRAIVAALDGTDDPVNSPTFVLVQQYDVRISITHIDAYRLSGSDDFLALGADEILATGDVCLIEWADRVADVLPADHLRIDIVATSPASRQFELTGRGQRARELIAQLERALAPK